MNHPTRPARPARGFTLVEMTLAIVVGALVLLGVSGVFAATRNMDRIFGDRYKHSTQLHITQMTIRKTMLSLLILEDQRQAQNTTQTGDDQIENQIPARSRIILETDPVYASIPGQWQPQRFEVVVSTPPIALNMATKAAAWARINDRDENSLDFSSSDASSGVLRAVFELRPDGSRERIMRQAGIMDPDPRADEKYALIDSTPAGWTLWWRPILRTESEFLRSGGAPLADSAGTQKEIRFRLAGAIPLVQNIELCSWTIYKSDQKINEYDALEMSGLPAYAEFELLLLNGQYASWMFEIDWVLGDDPLDMVNDDAASDDQDDNNNDGGNNTPDIPGNQGGTLPGRDNQNGNLGNGGDS
ncbi:MAG: prepilin-type N-terminal cleavage/methylation domain-containing protein [Phycisphaerales bacterium]|nr:prepilin-type N-terminal cleavage/methylation domain-containing protein [Phycisphaerales bacterium]